MKLFSILFAVLFGMLSLAPNMQGGQFLKLNELIEHYETHQKSNQRFTSFMSFVKEHYFNNARSSSDEQNMPFKSTVVTVTVLAHIQAAIAIPQLQQTFEPTEIPATFGEPSGIIQKVSLNIWNPPKMG